jgi:hypothetical protein
MTMITSIGCKLARLLVVAALTFAATLLLADPGSAAARKLSGTYSDSKIQDICTGAGGAYYGKGTGGSGQYYGCSTAGATITCTKGVCTCAGGKNCAAVAKGGGSGERPPSSSSAGNASASGTRDNNKHPITNVNQPVAVGRSSHSGSKH